MPIKIIGYDEKILKTITCKNCGAINQYAPVDVRELSSGKDISGTMCTTKGFNCGQCNNQVITYSD